MLWEDAGDGPYLPISLESCNISNYAAYGPCIGRFVPSRTKPIWFGFLAFDKLRKIQSILIMMSEQYF